MNQQKFCKKKKNPSAKNKVAFKLKYKQHKIDLQQNTPLDNLCKRCFDIISWKLNFGQYKKLKQPGKCSVCKYKRVVKAYRNVCDLCAQDQKICTKCSKPTKKFENDVNKKDNYENEKLVAMKNLLKKFRECSRRKIDRLLDDDLIIFKDDKFLYRETMQEVEGLQLKKKFRQCNVDSENLEDLDEFLNGPIDDTDESASYNQDDQLKFLMYLYKLLYIVIQNCKIRFIIFKLIVSFFWNMK